MMVTVCVFDSGQFDFVSLKCQGLEKMLPAECSRLVQIGGAAGLFPLASSRQVQRISVSGYPQVISGLA